MYNKSVFTKLVFDKSVYNKVVWCCLLLNGAVFAEDLPDPTRPLEYSATTSTQQRFTLHSILISGSRKVAVINGVKLNENDWIGGKQLVRIERDFVSLRDNNGVIELSLYGKQVRQ